MMVEVPAAALMLEQFEGADFFSFGTNDLAQYLIASTREDVDFAAHTREGRAGCTAPARLCRKTCR